MRVVERMDSEDSDPRPCRHEGGLSRRCSCVYPSDEWIGVHVIVVDAGVHVRGELLYCFDTFTLRAMSLPTH